MTATLPTAREPRPYRVVDRYQRGWLTATDPCTTYPRLDDRTWTLAELEDERAPLRPVVVMPGDEYRTLVDALAGAGREAVATVMAGLLTLSQRCYRTDGSDARLIAGDPESWGSRLLPRFAWEVGINLSSSRFDPRVLRIMDGVIGRWIFDSQAYVEVAGNLASVLSEVVERAGGYGLVTDQWLRNGALASEIEKYVTSKL